MLTTSALRRAWGNSCSFKRTTLGLYGAGRVSVRSEIVPAVEALDACLRNHAYQTRRQDTGAYNCRLTTGGSGLSLHGVGIALDLNWTSNPYGRRLVTDMPVLMRRDIKAIRTGNGKQVWGWGGDWSGNKDAMHWQIVCSPADLATGIVGYSSGDTGSSSGSRSVLSRGMRGQDVKFVQELLNYAAAVHGAGKIAADGIFGAGTEKVVRAFQRAARIGVDGKVGPGTLKALADKINAPKQSTTQVLKVGSSGNGVKFMQGLLNIVRPLHKGPKVAVDGVFGSGTRSAVIAFQRFANGMSRLAGGPGIAVDGLVGRATQDALAFWVNASK